MKKKVALLMWMLCWITASAFAYEGEPFYYARQWRRDIVLYAQPSLDSQILGTYPLYTVSFDIDVERWEPEWILQEFWDEAQKKLLTGWVYCPNGDRQGGLPPMYEWSLAQGADNYVLVTAEKAQLRAGPSEDAPSRGEVVQGNALYVGYYIDGWILASTHPCVRDRAERAEGWIDSRHVAFNAPYARLTRSSGAYTWPAEDAERIERLREGEEVPVIAETDESYIVLREGGVGFVQKNAAELVHAPQRTYINGEYALKDVAAWCDVQVEESGAYLALEPEEKKTSRACEALAYPDADALVLADLPEGAAYPVGGECGAYYIIQLGEGVAFVEKTAFTSQIG